MTHPFPNPHDRDPMTVALAAGSLTPVMRKTLTQSIDSHELRNVHLNTGRALCKRSLVWRHSYLVTRAIHGTGDRVRETDLGGGWWRHEWMYTPLGQAVARHIIAEGGA